MFVMVVGWSREQDPGILRRKERATHLFALRWPSSLSSCFTKRMRRCITEQVGMRNDDSEYIQHVSALCHLLHPEQTPHFFWFPKLCESPYRPLLRPSLGQSRLHVVHLQPACLLQFTKRTGVSPFHCTLLLYSSKYL